MWDNSVNKFELFQLQRKTITPAADQNQLKHLEDDVFTLNQFQMACSNLAE